VNENPKKLTPNIVKRAKYELEKWLKEEGIEEKEADIVLIDNETENIEARIDALVFRLYQIKEDEIATVFRFLKTSMSHQRKVFEIFRKL